MTNYTTLILRILLSPLWLALFVVQAIAATFGARRTDDADPHAGGGA